LLFSLMDLEAQVNRVAHPARQFIPLANAIGFARLADRGIRATRDYISRRLQERLASRQDTSSSTRAERISIRELAQRARRQQFVNEARRLDRIDQVEDFRDTDLQNLSKLQEISHARHPHRPIMRRRNTRTVRRGARRTRSYRRRGAIIPRANTTQHDSRGRYSYRPMPRRRRRMWKRFVRKVTHVALQKQPLQVYTADNAVNQTSAANEMQIWGRMIGGTTVSGNDEILQVFKSAYNLANAAACVPYKLFLKSMCMDIEVTNNGSSTVIMDVYSLVNRATYNETDDLGSQWVQAIGDVAAPAGGGSYSSAQPTLTVFDAPNFCSYWKTLNKTEYLIPANQTLTFQVRLPYNKHIEGKTLITDPQCLPRYARGMFFMWHGQPNNGGAEGAAQIAATSLTFSYQTNVHYAFPPGPVAREQGFTN